MDIRMKTIKLQSIRLIATGVLALGAVWAHGSAGDDRGNCAPPPPMRVPDPGPFRGMPHLLMSNATRGVELTNAQQDKVFALHHADMPSERENMKVAVEAMEELRRLTASDQFDIGKAKGLADRHAQALARMLLLHAQRDADVRALLTPGQRQQFDAASRMPDQRHGFPQP